MTDQTPDGAESVVEADVDYISAERLIFFSDAVVAIAITLLALGLTVPSIPSSASNYQIAMALWQRPERLAYLAFLISFVVIGSHWRSHHRLFRYVSRLDQRLISLNLGWLLMIVIMPFATRLIAGNGGFGVRFGFYATIQVLIMVLFLLMSRHIRGHDLLRPNAPPPSSQDDDTTLIAVAAMFAISIPVAFVTQWAFAFWVASSPAAKIVRRLRERDQGSAS
jgi:uncharacterized membrane protein